MKITIFGNRIQDFGGFEENDLHKSIKENIKVNLEKLKSEHKNLTVITGLNIGLETWIAEIAKSLNIGYHVYIPFDNPHVKWPKFVQQQYLYLLKESSKKKQIDTGEFDSKKLHNKEVKMIEDCDIILTAYTQPMPILKFIERSGKTVIDLLPKQESTDDEFNIPF